MSLKYPEFRDLPEEERKALLNITPDNFNMSIERMEPDDEGTVMFDGLVHQIV